MRRKMARSAPPPPFGPPGVAAVVRAASLACQNAVKAQKFVPLQESSEESRINNHRRLTLIVQKIPFVGCCQSCSNYDTKYYLEDCALMLTSSRYLMNSSPIHCMFCSEPFRRRDGFVEFWRTATGDHFCSEFCADDAEEALFKKRHTTSPVELPRW